MKSKMPQAVQEYLHRLVEDYIEQVEEAEDNATIISLDLGARNKDFALYLSNNDQQ